MDCRLSWLRTGMIHQSDKFRALPTSENRLRLVSANLASCSHQRTFQTLPGIAYGAAGYLFVRRDSVVAKLESAFVAQGARPIDAAAGVIFPAIGDAGERFLPR